ncbi:DUF1016 family protein [candidate division FCPU426 bacterium]|nr:DUF1016 family protein [candidate division FCPU426 bacterium]
MVNQYAEMLNQIKARIRQAQTRAMFSANAEMIRMYWDIGRIIRERQQQKGWGAGVIPRLSRDISNELPEVKGFSERNIGRMIAFYREYSDSTVILPQPVAKLLSRTKEPQAVEGFVSKIPWGHNILLMEKVKNIADRFWYIRQVIDQGWSRDVLLIMIKNQAHKHQGKAVHNFKMKLPPVQSDLAEQALKDPYVFDFLTLEEPFHERELETSLIRHLQKFLLELGQGFAFVGRQYHVEIGDEDYYIDLLFYHLKLRCFIVIELKKGAFKPEYIGKINFYCNIVDDQLKQKEDKQTIGLILCQNRKSVLAEYSLRGVGKPIGVSEYELTRTLPKKLKSSLPSVEDIEQELNINQETKLKRKIKMANKGKLK